MIATILQLLGITVANVGAYAFDPALGVLVTGASLVYVGLAVELADR